MKTFQRFLAIFTLAAMLTLTTITPALAFDGRGGDVIVIEAGEVIEDDLYVSAGDFTLDGTVKGDLVVVGELIVINGTVEGDLIAAANTIVIEGTVLDDVRIAGAALQLGENAVIGGDVIAAGASMEAKPGSSISNDMIYAGAQALLEGSIGRNLLVGAGGLELNGEVAGDATIEVGDVEEAGPSPSTYITDTRIAVPNVAPGLVIAEGAKIKGSFTYTQSQDINIPAGTVEGKVTRNEPVVNADVEIAPPTTGELAASWIFDLFRTIATLLLFGFLLAWLAPAFIKGLSEKLQTQPVPSFGWGVVAYAAFFFTLLLIVVAMIVGGILFGIISLGGVTATIIWVGILAIFALIVAFVLFTGFGAQALAAWISGKWLLGRFNPALAEHRFWPLLLGAVLVGLLVSLPGLGWLFGFLIMLFGLGALWLWGRDRMSKPAPVVVVSQ
ncbi:MAG: polymer-forming cytoskeletal protein [Anaerolineae bacterium]|nr:polymer-forming cytoskeletal protein [Anaerolineae bacterium]